MLKTSQGMPHFWLFLLKHKIKQSIWCLIGWFVACPNGELLGTQQNESQKCRHLYTLSTSRTNQKLGRDFLQNSFSLSQLRPT